MTGLANSFLEQRDCIGRAPSEHGRHTAEDQGDLQNLDIGVLYVEFR